MMFFWTCSYALAICSALRDSSAMLYFGNVSRVETRGSVAVLRHYHVQVEYLTAHGEFAIRRRVWSKTLKMRYAPSGVYVPDHQ